MSSFPNLPTCLWYWVMFFSPVSICLWYWFMLFSPVPYWGAARRHPASRQIDPHLGCRTGAGIRLSREVQQDFVGLNSGLVKESCKSSNLHNSSQGACQPPLQGDSDKRPQSKKRIAWSAWPCEAHLPMWMGKRGHWPEQSSFGRELLCARGDQCWRLNPSCRLVELWSPPPSAVLWHPPRIRAPHWSWRLNPAPLWQEHPTWCSRFHWRAFAT